MSSTTDPGFVDGVEPELPDDVDEAVAQWEGERTPAGLAAMAVFARISRIGPLQRAIFNARHQAAGLTFSSFDVLATLRRSGPDHTCTAGALAKASMVSTGATTMRLDKMEQDGLIERTRDSVDRRVVYVTMTAKGLALIDGVHRQHVRAQEVLLGDLTPDEVDQLRTLLRKLETSIVHHQGEAAAVPIDEPHT